VSLFSTIGAPASAARVATIAGLWCALTLPAGAADVTLPPNLSWTAYETGSSGYAQSVGLGQMLTKNYGVSLRIIPGKNDVSRMTPLKLGHTEVCACGIAAYYAQEGVYMFAHKDWGPQPVYNLFNNIGRNGATLTVAGDVGIKTAADLRGKRIAWVKGAPALNLNAEAVLAFGGLTWDDVQKVEVPGFRQSMDAILNNQADAGFASTITAMHSQMAASPRGIYYIPMPHGDEAGWKRTLDVAPYFAKGMVTAFTQGAQNPGPFEGVKYPYPLFVVTDKATDDLAYGLTYAIMENYEDYKEAGPGMDGYQLQNQAFDYVMPYHAGAVRYFKEKGAWKPEHDAHNQAMHKRQEVLAAAWKDVLAKNVADDAFAGEWMKLRAAALEKAGMPVVFR
jgi:TRAP transporter TAXI family solute receptor